MSTEMLADDRPLKVILLGDASVGKTSLIARYVGRWSAHPRSTIGADFFVKRATLKDGTNVTLQIWDTSGCERYYSVVRSYYRGARAVILAFDMSKAIDLDRLDHWMASTREHSDSQTSVVLVGLKKDIAEDTRHVLEADMSRFVQRWSIRHYFEASAKTGEGVDDVFATVAQESHDSAATISGAFAHRRGGVKLPAPGPVPRRTENAGVAGGSGGRGWLPSCSL